MNVYSQEQSSSRGGIQIDIESSRVCSIPRESVLGSSSISCGGSKGIGSPKAVQYILRRDSIDIKSSDIGPSEGNPEI